MAFVKLGDLAKHIKLKLVYKSTNADNVMIKTPEIMRPGLQMAGYFGIFSYERIQVLGITEISYINTLTKEEKEERLDKFFSYDIPVLIIANDMEVDEDIVKFARKHDRTVMSSCRDTMKLVSDIINYLEEQLAPETTVHGVCTEVFGIGVFIRGKSGIGKSETALELVKRGHRLIADDAILIRKIDNILKGYCPELTRHLMEIRGIGILNVMQLYGVGAVKINQNINLVINLEEWIPDKEYDRLGIDQEKIEILGVEIPQITIPVRPGRNIATIVEVAAKNYRQKLLGYSSLDMYNMKFFNE